MAGIKYPPEACPAAKLCLSVCSMWTINLYSLYMCVYSLWSKDFSVCSSREVGCVVCFTAGLRDKGEIFPSQSPILLLIWLKFDHPGSLKSNLIMPEDTRVWLDQLDFIRAALPEVFTSGTPNCPNSHDQHIQTLCHRLTYWLSYTKRNYQLFWTSGTPLRIHKDPQIPLWEPLSVQFIVMNI